MKTLPIIIFEWFLTRAYNLATDTENGRNVCYMIESYFTTFRK